MSNEGKRQSAMQWWNNLSPLRKTQICDTNTTLVGTVRRWETLTGREIESLWVSEAMTNEYNAVEKLHNDIIPMDTSNAKTGKDAVDLMNADAKMTLAHASELYDLYITKHLNK